MKRTIIILTALLFAGLASPSASRALAQTGLHIGDIFEGKVVERQHMQESLVRGSEIAAYKLSVLHTVRFQADAAERAKADALFCQDMAGHVSGDDSSVELERRDGMLYYAIVQIADTRKGLHRYICYQCRPDGSAFHITLAYIEGKATLADLRKTFKKK